MSDKVDDFLAHYGVTGMKWGKTNAPKKEDSVQNPTADGPGGGAGGVTEDLIEDLDNTEEDSRYDVFDAEQAIENKKSVGNFIDSLFDRKYTVDVRDGTKRNVTVDGRITAGVKAILSRLFG